jgi:hypothetical protein
VRRSLGFAKSAAAIKAIFGWSDTGQLQPLPWHQRELIEHDPHEAIDMSVARIAF